MVSLLFALAIVFSSSTVNAAEPLPNIVHIVVDDLGWSYRPGADNTNEESETPHMNSLVENGLYLDRFYVHKICSPSRSALLSGRSSIHVNVENVGPDVYNPEEPLTGYQGVALNMTLMSGHLKQAGYKTRFVGKWDIGMASIKHHPKNRGFDSWFGYWHHSNDYWTQTEGTCQPTTTIATTTESISKSTSIDVYDLWRYDIDLNADGPAFDSKNDDSCSEFHQDGSLPSSEFIEQKERTEIEIGSGSGTCVFEEELLNQEVSSIISSHNRSASGGGPLFLMYAMHLVHWPLQVPQNKVEQFQSIDDERRRKMVSMVSYMDDAIGSVVDTIKANDDNNDDVVSWSNTLLVVHSDNGGEIIFVGTCGGNNYPLRGGKFSNWEGGIRSFGVISGGYLPESRRGLIESNLFGIEDWYATYSYGIANINASDQIAAQSNLPSVDSINQWPLIIGDINNISSSSPPPRDEIIIGDTSALTYNGQGDTLVGGLIKLINGTLYKVIVGAKNKNYLVDQDVLSGPYYPDVHDLHNDISNVPLLLRPQAHTRYCGRNLTSLIKAQDESSTSSASSTSTTCMFNVVENPNEDQTYELAAQYPQVFEDMISRIDELQASVLSPFRGDVDPLACDQALNGYSGYWGPWLDLVD